MANKLDMILKLTNAQENIAHIRNRTSRKTDMYVEYDILYNYVDCLLTGLLKDVTAMDAGAKVDDGPMVIGPKEEFKSPHQQDRDKLLMVYEYMYKTDPTFKLYVDSK